MNFYDVECPYCEYSQSINHDDGYGYEEDEIYQQQCEECGKYFTYTTSISYYYETKQAACLNGGEHKWKATTTSPVEYTRMFCTDCDERRTPTEEEWIEIKKDRKNS